MRSPLAATMNTNIEEEMLAMSNQEHFIPGVSESYQYTEMHHLK